jgi:hypothetical protein
MAQYFADLSPERQDAVRQAMQTMTPAVIVDLSLFMQEIKCGPCKKQQALEKILELTAPPDETLLRQARERVLALLADGITQEEIAALRKQVYGL